MTPPISRLIVLLLLCIPGILALGRYLGHWLGADRQLRAVLTPSFALTPWLLAVHVIGRWRQSFSVGLAGGTLLVSLLGTILFVSQRKTFRPHHGPKASWAMWIGTALSMALLVPMAFSFGLHDVQNQTGHLSLPAEMLNDIYPPRHLTFPDSELNYHYGFDLFAAMTAALTRLRMDRALGVATVLCWGWAFSLVWVIGERILRARGWIVAMTVMYAGGYPLWAISSRTESVADTLWRGHFVEGMMTNPSITSYFFQHPWTLGMPLAFSIFLLADARTTRTGPRLFLIGMLFALLSLSQVTLFMTCIPALAAQEFFSTDSALKNAFQRLLGGRFSFVAGLSLVLTMALALLVAQRLGGFFVRIPGHTGPILEHHWGIVSTFAGTLQWQAWSFGLVLPLGFIGLALTRRMRILGSSLILGGLLVMNSYRIKDTWDIVKFATIAAMMSGFFAGLVVDRILSWRRRWMGVPVASILLVCTIALGISHPLACLYERDNYGSRMPRWPRMLSGDDDIVATYLRAHIKAGEIVYRDKSVMKTYAQWAGLPQVWTEHYALAFGYTNWRLYKRDSLLAKPSRSPAPYLKDNIRWFVLDTAYDQEMIKVADEWLEKGRAREVLTSGRLRVIELVR